MAGSWGMSSSRSRVGRPPMLRASSRARSASSSARGSYSSVMRSPFSFGSRLGVYPGGERVHDLFECGEPGGERRDLDALVGAVRVGAVGEAEADGRDAAAERGVGVGGGRVLL